MKRSEYLGLTIINTVDRGIEPGESACVPHDTKAALLGPSGLVKALDHGQIVP